MENSPKITVITVTYNCVSTLEATIQSVLGQSYPNIEYIIIDGGSGDGTVGVIERYSDRLAYWVSEQDGGIYDAMNKGIAAATGDYINFMNAGDMFHAPTALADLVSNMDLDADVVCGDTIIRTAVGQYVRNVPPFSMLDTTMIIGHQSALIRTALHQQIPYDTSFKISGDYNFFYTCYKQGKVFQYIASVVATFDAVEGVSNNNYRLSVKENARIQGVKDTLLRKIFVEIGYAWYLTKRALKRTLPPKMMALVKRTTHHKWIDQ